VVFGSVPRFGYAFVISFQLVHCLPRNWVNSLLGEVSRPQQAADAFAFAFLLLMMIMMGMMGKMGMRMWMMASLVMSS